MPDVPLKEYVDRRFEEIDKRVLALNTARQQSSDTKAHNTAIAALLVAVLALVVGIADVVVWVVRR